MIVPGSNLLTLALNLIGRQSVAWYAYLGMTTNDAGYQVASWSAPVTIGGSFQPVSNTTAQFLGMDWTKNYATFYAERDFTEVVRDKTGDKLEYAGRTFQCLSKNDWFNQDGWAAVLCVELTNDGE